MSSRVAQVVEDKGSRSYEILTPISRLWLFGQCGNVRPREKVSDGRKRCGGIPRGCVEVGRDHGGLEPRKPKREEEMGTSDRIRKTRENKWLPTGFAPARAPGINSLEREQ